MTRMTRMNCRATRRRLPAYLGGELAPARVAGVRAHLERCPACRAEHHRFEQALGALRRAAQVPVTECDPEPIWRAIRGKLPGRDLSRPVPGVSRLWHRPVPAPLAAGIVALVAAVGVTLAILLWPFAAPPDRPTIPEPGGPLIADAIPFAPTFPAYRPIAPPRFALENASRAEAGTGSCHLPCISQCDEAPGEEFILEQVIYRPDENRRMRF